MKNFWILILGLATGFASSALGIGGGTIIVPGLVILFKHDIKKALGTSLATMVSIALVGALSHYFIRHSNIRLIIVLLVAVGSILGSKLGAILANKISSKILKVLFAVLLFLVGLKLIGIINIPVKEASGSTFYPFLLGLGFLTGIVSALFGLGGGILMVPSFNLFFGLDMHQAIATSLAVIVPTSFAGALFHKEFGNIDMRAVRFLVPAGLVAAVLGAVVANLLPSSTLRFIFGVLIIVWSFRMLFLKSLPQVHSK